MIKQSKFSKGFNLILLVTEGFMQNFRTLEQPVWEKCNNMRKKEEEEKNAIDSGHYIMPARPKGSAHMLFTRTKKRR